MIDVVKFQVLPSKKRIGVVNVKYHDLTICCELALYKKEKLWIRLPEFWMKKPDSKFRYVYWTSLQKSDEFQEKVLSKIFEMVGFDLTSAIQVQEEFLSKLVAEKAE